MAQRGSQARAGAFRASRSRWAVFARMVIDHYGGTCHICGHGGARQVDHLESVTDHPELEWDLRNCRPAHGAPGNPCPQCSADCGRKIHCNQLRGPMSVERARRLIAERAAESARLTGTRKARPPDRNPEAGREW